MKEDGTTDWSPNYTNGKQIINLNHRDEEMAKVRTVIATANIGRMMKNGVITEEDYNKGLEKNAQHINMTRQELSDLIDLYVKESDEYEKETSTPETEKLG